jgi:undecaprenyl phosphate-alpha-L-ara4N flippase subunit ArnE
MAGILINPWLLAEFTTLGIGAVIWVLTLRRVSLSVAYPFMSLAFGVSLAAAWFVFGEVVTAKHVAGIAIIIGGVVVASWPARDRE